MTKYYPILMSMLVFLLFFGNAFAVANCDTNCKEHCKRTVDRFFGKVTIPGEHNTPCYELCKQEREASCKERNVLSLIK